MVERVVMAISYRRLMNYLADDLGYEERRAKRTIAALRRAEPSILKAFHDGVFAWRQCESLV